MTAIETMATDGFKAKLELWSIPIILILILSIILAALIVYSLEFHEHNILIFIALVPFIFLFTTLILLSLFELVPNTIKKKLTLYYIIFLDLCVKLSHYLGKLRCFFIGWRKPIWHLIIIVVGIWIIFYAINPMDPLALQNKSLELNWSSLNGPAYDPLIGKIVQFPNSSIDFAKAFSGNDTFKYLLSNGTIFNSSLEDKTLFTAALMNDSIFNKISINQDDFNTTFTNSTLFIEAFSDATVLYKLLDDQDIFEEVFSNQSIKKRLNISEADIKKNYLNNNTRNSNKKSIIDNNLSHIAVAAIYSNEILRNKSFKEAFSEAAQRKNISLIASDYDEEFKNSIISTLYNNSMNEVIDLYNSDASLKQAVLDVTYNNITTRGTAFLLMTQNPELRRLLFRQSYNPFTNFISFLWYYWQELLILWLLLELALWVQTARKSMAILDFDESTKDSIKPAEKEIAQGLASLLVARLDRLKRLYCLVDEGRPISSMAVTANPIPAAIRSQDAVDISPNVFADDSKLSFGTLSIPGKFLNSLIDMITRRPKISGSIQKTTSSDKEAFILTASATGLDRPLSWRVDSQRSLQERKEDDPVPKDSKRTRDDMVTELSYQIFTDLNFGESKVIPWEATWHFTEGLRRYRDSLHGRTDRLMKLHEAKKHFMQTLAMDEDFPWAHHNLGVVFTELEQHESAKAAFQRSIALHPDQWQSCYALALNLYENWGDYDQAIRLCENVLNLKPDHLGQAKAYDLLGLAWCKKSSLEKAQDNAKDNLHKACIFSLLSLAASELRGLDLSEMRMVASKCLSDLSDTYYKKCEKGKKDNKNLEKDGTQLELVEIALNISDQEPYLHAKLAQIYADKKENDKALEEINSSLCSPEVEFSANLARIVPEDNENIELLSNDTLNRAVLKVLDNYSEATTEQIDKLIKSEGIKKSQPLHTGLEHLLEIKKYYEKEKWGFPKDATPDEWISYMKPFIGFREMVNGFKGEIDDDDKKINEKIPKIADKHDIDNNEFIDCQKIMTNDSLTIAIWLLPGSTTDCPIFFDFFILYKNILGKTVSDIKDIMKENKSNIINGQELIICKELKYANILGIIGNLYIKDKNLNAIAVNSESKKEAQSLFDFIFNDVMKVSKAKIPNEYEYFKEYLRHQWNLPPQDMGKNLQRWQKLSNKYPLSSLHHKNLGRAYMDADNLILAKKEFEQALLLNPYDPRTRYNLGKIHIKSLKNLKRSDRNRDENLNMAKKYLMEAIELFEDDIYKLRSYFWLGQWSYLDKNYSGAISYLKIAEKIADLIDLKNDDGLLIEHVLADAYSGLKDCENAKITLNNIINKLSNSSKENDKKVGENLGWPIYERELLALSRLCLATLSLELDIDSELNYDIKNELEKVDEFLKSIDNNEKNELYKYRTQLLSRLHDCKGWFIYKKYKSNERNVKETQSIKGKEKAKLQDVILSIPKIEGSNAIIKRAILQASKEPDLPVEITREKDIALEKYYFILRNYIIKDAEIDTAMIDYKEDMEIKIDCAKIKRASIKECGLGGETRLINLGSEEKIYKQESTLSEISAGTFCIIKAEILNAKVSNFQIEDAEIYEEPLPNIDEAIDQFKISLSRYIHPQAYLHLALAYECKLQEEKDAKIVAYWKEQAMTALQHARDLDLNEDYISDIAAAEKRLGVAKESAPAEEKKKDSTSINLSITGTAKGEMYKDTAESEKKNGDKSSKDTSSKDASGKDAKA